MENYSSYRTERICEGVCIHAHCTHMYAEHAHTDTQSLLLVHLHLVEVNAAGPPVDVVVVPSCFL